MSDPIENTLERFKLIVAYNGTRFKGFQRQSSGMAAVAQEGDCPANRKRRRCNDGPKKKKVPLTIQECLEDALELYTGLGRDCLRVRFAGRTDGGVHARGQVVAVSLPESVMVDGREPWRIRKSINSRLPEDISVEKVEPLVDYSNFDPRKDAVRKRYSYTLKFRKKVFDFNGQLLPFCSNSGPNCIRNALDPNTLWICPWPLSDTNMERYCQLLTGEHDYSAFVHKRSRREKENVLTVARFTYDCLEKTKEAVPVLTIRFQVEAKGFRRGMVRNLVGFVVDLCRGQLDESIFETIWSGTDEAARSVNSAPPFGLCLEQVTY